MKNPLFYHVFRKPRRLKSGKKVYKWYYYWLDQDGHQYQRVCQGCRNRSEAESYIRELAPPPGMAAAMPLPASGGAIVVKKSFTLKEIAETMFIPGSAHISRRLQLGKSVDMETMAISRHFIEIMIGLWGDMKLEALGVDVVMPWLFQDRRSGSWKNRFLGILGEVFLEAPWYGCHAQPPIFQRFADNYKKADIFSTEELERLFKRENFPSELFYLFYLLCLSGGMRLGEVRAVRAKQIIFDKKIIIIDGFCKQDGRRTNYNKKGTPDNPKFRLVFLPDLTLNQMAAWINGQRIGPDDFCFSIDGRPITADKAEKVFYQALLKSGIIPVPEVMPDPEYNSRGRRRRKKLKPPDDRKLVPHSLRYTFVSRMRRELSAVELLPMTGHTTVKMVDYYNRKVLDLALASLPKTGAAAVNTLFA